MMRASLLAGLIPFILVSPSTVHERSSKGQIDGQLHGQGRLPVRVENVGEPLLLFVCAAG